VLGTTEPFQHSSSVLLLELSRLDLGDYLRSFLYFLVSAVTHGHIRGSALSGVFAVMTNNIWMALRGVVIHDSNNNIRLASCMR
jgi:hypothetical protein